MQVIRIWGRLLAPITGKHCYAMMYRVKHIFSLYTVSDAWIFSFQFIVRYNTWTDSSTQTRVQYVSR